MFSISLCVIAWINLIWWLLHVLNSKYCNIRSTCVFAELHRWATKRKTILYAFIWHKIIESWTLLQVTCEKILTLHLTYDYSQWLTLDQTRNSSKHCTTKKRRKASMKCSTNTTLFNHVRVLFQWISNTDKNNGKRNCQKQSSFHKIAKQTKSSVYAAHIRYISPHLVPCCSKFQSIVHQLNLI